MQALTKTLKILILASVAVLIFYSKPSTASCYCPSRTLKQIYCEADYVAVITATFNYSSYINLHEIDVLQVTKATPQGNKTLASGYLFSPPFYNECSVDLDYRKYYLIAGKGTELDLCDFVKDTDELTNEEKKVFKGDYEDSC